MERANLLKADVNYTYATTVRDNNTTMFSNLNTPSTNLVSFAGGVPTCWTLAGNPGPCNAVAGGGTQTYGTFGNPTPFPAFGAAAAAGATWIVTNPGTVGSYNTVSPLFSSVALDDTFRPTSKLNINAGLRYERYQYDLASMNNPGQISGRRPRKTKNATIRLPSRTLASGLRARW